MLVASNGQRVNHPAREKLILEHREMVRHLALALSESVHANRTRLEDLISVGVEALILAADLYDPGLGITFGAYARHRVRGAILDSSSRWFHQANRHQPIDEVPESQLPRVDSTERRAETRQAISQLPDQQRRVLWLYYENGLTMAEIAVKLEVTSSRVSQIRSEAIRGLRKTLKSK